MRVGLLVFRLNSILLKASTPPFCELIVMNSRHNICVGGVIIEHVCPKAGIRYI